MSAISNHQSQSQNSIIALTNYTKSSNTRNPNCSKLGKKPWGNMKIDCTTRPRNIRNRMLRENLG